MVRFVTSLKDEEVKNFREANESKQRLIIVERLTTNEL